MFSVKLPHEEKCVHCIYFKKSNQIRVFCTNNEIAMEVMIYIWKAVAKRLEIDIGRP